MNGAAASVSYPAEKAVKISWVKNKEAAKYVIYRMANRYGKETGKYKKYRTLSRNTLSITDNKVKSGWQYDYEIRAYNRKGKLCGAEYATALLASAAMAWDDYQISDASYSTKQITLNFYRSVGMKIAGCALYRKDQTAGEKKYRQIAVFKGNKTGTMRYRDHSVKAGHTYGYRLRSYRTKNGKKVYGPWSYTVNMSAVRKTAHLAVKLEKPVDLASGELVLSVTSRAGNADLVFRQGEYILEGLSSYYDPAEQSYISPEDEVALTGCSTDGSSWMPIKTGCVLSPGKTIYLRFKLAEETLQADELPDEPEISTYDAVTYNGLTSSASLDTKTGSGSASTCLEYYH